MQVTKIQMSIGGMLLSWVTGSVQAAVLQPDPAWQEGKLDNGFSWQVLVTPQRPTDRVEVRLVVDTGSLMESAQQTGFSWLIPQLAMHHSATMTPSELNTFWREVNTSMVSPPVVINSYDMTLFSLSLPNGKPEVLKQSLSWLADSMGKLPITSDNLLKLKGEAQPIVTYPPNIHDPWWRYRLKGSLMLGHDPAPALASVDSKALAEFYQQNYTPDVMTLYVAGNVDSRKLIEQIQKQFSVLHGSRTVAAPVASLAPMSQEPVSLIGDAGGDSNLALVWDDPWTPVHDDTALYRYWLGDLTREALFARLKEQLARKSGKEQPVEVGVGCAVRFERSQCAINLKVTPDSVKTVLTRTGNAVLELEKKGFTQQEFDTLLAQKQQQLKNLFATYAQMDTNLLVTQRLLLQQRNMVDISPENYQQLRSHFLEALSLDKLNSAMRTLLSQEPVLVLTQPEGEPEGDVKGLSALYKQLTTLPVPETPAPATEHEEKQEKSGTEQP
ncbi:MAG: M16 family metallopeptidase [Enterobacteriaceae bacterium]